MPKKVTVIILVFVAAAAGMIWRVQNTKAKVARRESAILKGLTAEEVIMVLKNQATFEPERIEGIVKTAESRKTFLTAMKEYLSLAARARREGLADEPNFTLNLQVKENGLLAELYLSKLNAEQKKPFTIAKEAVDAVWKDPANERQFNEEMEALYAVQSSVAESMRSSSGTTQRLQGESLERARNSWARARILSGMAKADQQFMQQSVVQLRLKILEAGVLSAGYLAKHWVERIKANSDDIAAYLSMHLELALNRKRVMAELVLRRARAGEDFATLAKEFSEDRSTRDKGGLYEDYEKGAGLWPEVERAALGLEPGQVADRLIETKDGYHVVQLVSKKITKENGIETTRLSVRHILLQRRFEDPTVNKSTSPVPPPFKTAEEIAKDAIEKEKRRRFVDEVIQSEHISLPDDFQFS